MFTIYYVYHFVSIFHYFVKGWKEIFSVGGEMDQNLKKYWKRLKMISWNFWDFKNAIGTNKDVALKLAVTTF